MWKLLIGGLGRYAGIAIAIGREYPNHPPA
jgi:hypothetical protein